MESLDLTSVLGKKVSIYKTLLSPGLTVNAVKHWTLRVTNKTPLQSKMWFTVHTHKVLLMVVSKEVLEPAGPVVPPPQ